MSDSPHEKSIRREYTDIMTLSACIATLHVIIRNGIGPVRSAIDGFTADPNMRKFLCEFFDGVIAALENNFLEHIVQLENRLILLDAELTAILKDDAADCNGAEDNG